MLRSLLIAALLCSLTTPARAQEPSAAPSVQLTLPPRPRVLASTQYRRSTILMASLAAASGATAAALLTTQHGKDSYANPRRDNGSFLYGVGVAHAVFAGGYLIDLGQKVYCGVRARRAERAGHPFTVVPAMTGWNWVQVALSGAIFAGGLLAAPLVDTQQGKGFATTYAVHGAWMLAASVVRLIHARRREPVWMAVDQSGFRF